MNFLALGLLLGVASVSAPGPITMGLIQFTSVQSRWQGHLAGLGISAGDFAASGAALVVIGAGTAIPASVMFGIQIVSITYLFFVGIALVARPTAVGEIVGNIRRPGRTFFLATSLNPSVFGSWLAVYLAMPFVGNTGQLTLFASGVVLASFCWFQAVAAGVASFSHKLTERHLVAASRLGGVVTLMFGIWAAVNV